MAEVTVFVDDAVLGRLPPVCVIDGVPTDDACTVTRTVGTGAHLGPAWLLVLAGPLGWLALIVIASLRRGGETLTVTLPYSEPVYLRRIRAERARTNAMIVTVGMVAAAGIAWLQHPPDVRLLVLGLAAVGGAALWRVVVEGARVRSTTVGLDLDASRRWLTLSGVHDSFVGSSGDRTPAASSHALH